MQKIHFDVEKICNQTEAMYRDTPLNQFSDDKDRAAFLKRAGPVHVAFARFIYTEINSGIDPNLFRECAPNIIATMAAHAQGTFDAENMSEMQDAMIFIQEVAEIFLENLANPVNSGFGFDVEAVPSGSA